MKINSNGILKYIAEFLIVTFGLFLEIYVNNISSEERIKKEKEKSLSSIIEELNINKNGIEQPLKYHQFIKNEYE